jgi:hypothetical protein
VSKSASATGTRRIARGKAASQTDPQTKADFLDLERRWLLLAQSYEFTERLHDFSGETKRNVDKLQRV